MKRFALLAVLLFSAGPAVSQTKPPQVVEPDESIVLAVGEPRILRFAEPIKEVKMAVKGVADVIPQNDRMVTISGLKAGQTTLFVQNEAGRTVYTAMVTVPEEQGRLVKIYGQQRGGKDFIGVYCSETGCGRADMDKKLRNEGRDPDEPVSVTVSRPTADGGSITRHYRPN